MKSCSESRSDRLLLFGEGFVGRGEEVRAPPPPPNPARLTREGVVSRKQKEGKDQAEK